MFARDSRIPNTKNADDKMRLSLVELSFTDFLVILFLKGWVTRALVARLLRVVWQL